MLRSKQAGGKRKECQWIRTVCRNLFSLTQETFPGSFLAARDSDLPSPQNSTRRPRVFLPPPLGQRTIPSPAWHSWQVNIPPLKNWRSGDKCQPTVCYGQGEGNASQISVALALHVIRSSKAFWMVMCARRGRYTMPAGILSDAKEAACCVIHPVSCLGHSGFVLVRGKCKCGGPSSLPKTRQDSVVFEHQGSIWNRSHGNQKGQE